MIDAPPLRFSSVHLEDIAIVALRGSPGGTVTRHPELDEERRARLRSRLKHFSRYDWPSSLKEDPLLRRGYTLRQCCRLLVTLHLIDAFVPPGTAVPIASANELALLRLMAAAMPAPAASAGARAPTDMIAVIPLGDSSGLVATERWIAAESQRVRFLPRAELARLWSTDAELDFPGQRLPLDLGASAAIAWEWIRERQLLPDEARLALIAELDASTVPLFDPRATQIVRR